MITVAEVIFGQLFIIEIAILITGITEIAAARFR